MGQWAGWVTNQLAAITSACAPGLVFPWLNSSDPPLAPKLHGGEGPCPIHLSSFPNRPLHKDGRQNAWWMSWELVLASPLLGAIPHFLLDSPPFPILTHVLHVIAGSLPPGLWSWTHGSAPAKPRSLSPDHNDRFRNEQVTIPNEETNETERNEETGKCSHCRLQVLPEERGQVLRTWFKRLDPTVPEAINVIGFLSHLSMVIPYLA